MPGFTCCVPGCYNNSHRDRQLRFYTFPKDTTQREIWLKNISRAGVSGCFSTFQPTTGHRVCSVHFPGGRKTYTIRVPTLFPLRGVNERKSRRGRNRKVSAPATSSSIVITNVVSTAPADAEPAQNDAGAGADPGGTETGSDHPTVVQIGQNGEYLGSVHLPAAQGGGDGAGSITTAVVSSSTDLTWLPDTAAATAAAPPPPVHHYSVVSSPLDHCYSLTTGTTSAELLRKLNEQRDIIALMEVKMKEMKATIRQLRVTEAKLQEEVRERDRLLSAGAAVAAVAAVAARKKM